MKHYHFYIAAPLFSQAEKDYNFSLYQILTNRGYKVFLPQLTSVVAEEGCSLTAAQLQQIFNENLEALLDSYNLIAICDGADVDSGTAWEIGRFYGHVIDKGIGTICSSNNGKIFAVRSDFRKTGDDPDSGINLMIARSATRIFSDKDFMLRWIHANRKY